MRLRTVLGLLVFPIAAQAQGAPSVFDVVVQSASCKQDSNGRRICSYKVGKDLEFTILGVGDGDAHISILRSNWEGDYYARITLNKHCVIVAPGKARAPSARMNDFAFVSPRTGKAHRTREECAGDE